MQYAHSILIKLGYYVKTFCLTKKQMFYYCVLVHVFVSKCTFVDKMYNRDVFLIHHDEKCHFAEEE